MRPQVRTTEEAIERIATRQHGVVTRTQLLAAGLSPKEIKGRVGRGLLLPVHRGVYRVGHRAPSVEARYLAAVLACGRGAVLSGRAAGHLWGLLGIQPPPPEVTAPTEHRVPGVRTHRSHAIDSTTCRRIPVTAISRTLVDLAGELSEDALARACHEAGIRHGTTPAAIESVLVRRPNAPGAPRLRRVLDGDVRVTLSTLERVFLDRLRSAGLPLPETNRPAGGRRVDCRWPDQRLTVEVDGYRYHRSRHAWERDRRREREARARGDDFRRYTYGDVLESPGAMLRELQAVLG